MPEPITLEFLSKQCDRILDEMLATRAAIGETRDAMLRCIAKANEVQRLMEEFLALSRQLECD